MTNASPARLSAVELLKRMTLAGWLGTWALIGVGAWLPFVWRSIAALSASGQGRLGRPRLLLDPLGVSVFHTLDSAFDALRLLSFIVVVLAVVLADRMRAAEPRWLGWLTVAAAIAAFLGALWNPALYS